jgi:hypothetical protein
MIGALAGLYSSIDGSYNAASTLFGANEARMALANTVTAGMPPAAIGDVFQSDKALTLKAESAKFRFAAYNAMREMYQKMVKDNIEMQARSYKVWYG